MTAIKYKLIILLALVCSLSAIQSQPASQKPLVVTTASMFTDMAANIGGDLIEVASIVPIGGDPHIYEPTPGDVRLLLRAYVILQNGLTFEGWISELIQNSGTKASVHTITEGIEPIVSTMHQNATDPHAWMDPINGKIYALNIKNALIQLLPEHAAQINTQYDTYVAKLDDLDEYIREQINTIDTSKRILITSHDAFHYFGKRYGLRLESVLGTSTDADVRTSDLMRLNQVIRDNNIPAVFVESTINPKLLEQVATDNKIRIGGKLYSDSLGDENSPANTYLNMLKQNADVIVSGLSGIDADGGEQGSTASKQFPLLWLVLGIVLFGIAGFIWWKKTQAS
jgi:ABC-type Zn uptake system ZnuABC Zn-binding protein ZnuA